MLDLVIIGKSIRISKEISKMLYFFVKCVKSGAHNLKIMIYMLVVFQFSSNPYLYSIQLFQGQSPFGYYSGRKISLKMMAFFNMKKYIVNQNIKDYFLQ